MNYFASALLEYLIAVAEGFIFSFESKVYAAVVCEIAKMIKANETKWRCLNQDF